MMRKLLDVFKLYRFGIFSIILNRLFPHIFSYQNYIVYCYNLRKGVKEIPAPNKSVKIKKLSSPDDELFKQFRKKYPAPVFASRIKKKKETAYVAIKKGEVVAYAWVAEKELFIAPVNYTFTLKDDEIFLHSCFVSRENRGEGIHLLLLQKRLKDYSESDKYKTAYIGVLSVNKGSIKGIEKAGFKELYRVKYLRLFNKEKWWGLDDSLHFTVAGRFPERIPKAN